MGLALVLHCLLGCAFPFSSFLCFQAHCGPFVTCGVAVLVVVTAHGLMWYVEVYWGKLRYNEVYCGVMVHKVFYNFF